MSAVPGTNAASRPVPPLVRVTDLTVRFVNHDASVHAVNGVSFDLERGEVLGILGESGSGKSVTLKTLMRLLPARKTRLGGAINVAGQDVMALDARGLTAYRGSVVSMIFQEPMLAFDPVFSIGYQIAEAVVQHEGVSRAAGMQRALEMLERVQIPSAKRRLDAYPHEMSGGMRQRAMIALALACKPQLLLADEPTTALDATVQIQILLLRELQKEFGMAVIFVTHDVGVAVEVSDRVAVMYAGRFIETGSVRDIIRNPRHPYSQGLLAANVLPGMAERAVGAARERIEAIPGSPPNMAKVPEGCAFAPRCKYAEERCGTSFPPAAAVSASHQVHCIRG